jgi:hypothetical protein
VTFAEMLVEMLDGRSVGRSRAPAAVAATAAVAALIALVRSHR